MDEGDVKIGAGCVLLGAVTAVVLILVISDDTATEDSAGRVGGGAARQGEAELLEGRQSESAHSSGSGNEKLDQESRGGDEEIYPEVKTSSASIQDNLVGNGKGAKVLFPTPVRTWEDSHGRRVEGKVAEFDPDTGLAVLELSTGKVFEDFEANRLSDKDRNFLRQASQGRLQGRVVGCYDGDTLTLLIAGNTEYKIRLNGIDAPELRQDFGRRSKEALSDLVFDRQIVVVVVDKDRYGRFIGIPVVDGQDVCRVMLELGMAWHYLKYSDDPELAAAEKRARRSGAGLWADPSSLPPWEYRKR